MEIRDVIHGSIGVEPHELPIIDSRFFQRLRQIKQLGFAENSFPSATHNRYIHSLGAMHTAHRAFATIFGGSRDGSREAALGAARTGVQVPQLRQTAPGAYRRFHSVVRLAALLHDIGHGPLSHTTEFAMPDVRSLRVPGHNPKAKPRKADHEDYTLKIILDSGLTPLLNQAGAPEGFTAWHVAALVDPALELPADGADFFHERVDGEVIDFRPILKQLISSELDADRMDYLRRDSQSAGVSYGHFDFDWLVGSLTSHIVRKGAQGGSGGNPQGPQGKCYLALHHRALYSFEDFLISRFHMFLMVYFHYKSVVFDEMLGQYFASPDCDYALPADIEAYCDYNDAHLYSHLARSSNEWAKRITDKRPYRMLMELHSGIPATATAAREQERLLKSVRKNLDSQGISYLMKTSTGELSKYFRNPAQSANAPIFVRYDNHYSAPSIIPLEQCTDLFERYSEKRTITRLYVSPENYPLCRNQGRGSPLRYEDDTLPGDVSALPVGQIDPAHVLTDPV